MFVSDTGNQRIQVFDGNGAFLATWGTGGSAEGEFDRPSGIGVARDGYVYLADTANNRIQKFACP